MKGGHDVPITKIISRYVKSIANCAEITGEVDRLYSIDGEEVRPLFHLKEGRIGKIYTEQIPEWSRIILPK